MASAELARFPLMAHALVARLPLLTLLADFQVMLNDQFDSYRHAARYRPGLALRRLRSGVELLCELQQELLHPALRAAEPQAWPALDKAMTEVHGLRDLVALGARTSEPQQRFLLGLLEGMVQLHFASLDELLAEADATAMPWAELEREVAGLLGPWRAAGHDAAAAARPYSWQPSG